MLSVWAQKSIETNVLTVTTKITMLIRLKMNLMALALMNLALGPNSLQTLPTGVRSSRRKQV